MFLNREQQKEANPPYRELDINMEGCYEIWKNCFLHDPSGSFGVEVTGGCNPLRNNGKDMFSNSLHLTSLFMDFNKLKHNPYLRKDFTENSEETIKQI